MEEAPEELEAWPQAGKWQGGQLAQLLAGGLICPRTGMASAFPGLTCLWQKR